MIPHPGVQTDEALFALGLYPDRCAGADGWISIGGSRFPLMLMTYVGALKAWLYAAIFAVWTPSVWSIRLPALVIGAAAIAVFARVAALAAGKWAGLVIAVLLATDATYLLTVTFDWGPVAIQHFLLAFGAWQLLRFAQSGSMAALAWSGGAAGLAMWNKAIVAWMLAGIAAGLALSAWREIRRLASWRAAAVLAGSFAIGAAPFLWYNAANSMITFRDNVKSDPGDLPGKARMFLFNLEGSVMEGYLFTERTPGSAPGRRTNFLPWALLASILLTPFAGSRARSIGLFCAAAMAVSWVIMTQSGGGGSAHHAVLLWPLPHLWIASVAAALLERPQRWIGAITILAIAAAGLAGAAQIRRYHTMGSQGVDAPGWSDAILPLSHALRGYKDRWVILADWGLLSNLCVLTAEPSFSGLEMVPNDADLKRVFDIQDAVIVAPTQANAVVPGMRQGLMAYVKAKGIVLNRVAAIHNSRGRLDYEVFEHQAGVVR